MFHGYNKKESKGKVNIGFRMIVTPGGRSNGMD